MDYQIVSVKRNEKKIAYEATFVFEGVQISFIPVIVRTKKIAKESCRQYLYGGELTPEKTKLPSFIVLKMKDQAWAIFFKGKKKTIKKITVPNETLIIMEAQMYNERIDFLIADQPKKTRKELVMIIQKSYSESIQVNESKFKHLNYFQAKWLFEFSKNKIFIDQDGLIVVNKKKGSKDIKTIYFNINSAIRLQEHILDDYFSPAEKTCGELSKIDHYKNLGKEINELLVNWKNSSIDKDSLKEKIAYLAKQFTLSRNELKIDSKKLLDSITGLKDSLDRENPPAFATKTVAVLNKMEKRINDIENISSFIEKRKEVLTECRAEMKVEKMRATKDLITLIHIRNFAYYSDVNGIKINKIITTLDSLFIENFSSQKNQAVFYLQLAKGCISEVRKAKKYLRTALSILQS